ncbi:hypothetical protein M901_1972 [Bacteriovorax sp. DB6_IX]|nr:hypothetical protein M901_1972 [Bacteriovorax sp. DB6_IX]
MVSCKVVSNRSINRNFDGFVESLENNQKSLDNDIKIQMAEELKTKANQIAKLINRAPRLETWRDREYGPGRERSVDVYNESKDKIRTWMLDVKNLTMDIHAITYEAGKNSYATSEDGRMLNSPVQMAQNEMITLYSLTYLRNLSEGYITRSLGYINKLASKKMQKFSANDDEFKLEVMEQYMAYMGMMKIIDEDAKKTLTKLKRMRDKKILPIEYSENISTLLNEGKKKNKKKMDAFAKFKTETLTQEQVKEFDNALSQFEETFERSHFSLVRQIQITHFYTYLLLPQTFHGVLLTQW